MDNTVILEIAALAALIIGIFVGVLIMIFRGVLMGRKQRITEIKAVRIEAEARLASERMIDEARQESWKIKADSMATYRDQKDDIIPGAIIPVSISCPGITSPRPNAEVTCVKCKAPLEVSWKACPQCGHPVTQKPNKCKCGVQLQPGWKMCPACGTPIY